MQNRKAKTYVIKFSKKQINKIIEAFQDANTYEYFSNGDKYSFIKGYIASVIGLTVKGYTREELVTKMRLKGKED